MRKPNFIFILLDDFGWRDLACYGSSFYETPHIDRLATEGMRFSNAYAACPVCSPSRASLLTGKYPARLGLTDWIDWGLGIHPKRGKLIDAPYVDHLALEETSLAAALRQNGYQTWHVGKWHLGGEAYGPEQHGFDTNLGGSYYGSPHGGYFSPWNLPNLPEGKPGEYLTDYLTDEAIRLIRQSGDRPFFLNLWHYAVHTPIQAKAEDTARFKEKARHLGLDQVNPFVEGEAFPTDDRKQRRVTRRVIQSDPAYAAMIWNLDWNIGRLLAELEQAGLANDTVVIFTSDNGGLATSESSPTCNAPLAEGKGWMYEGGTREPLLVRWPGRIVPGSESSVPITSPDFYPTLLELAGLDARPEQHRDGVSFAPLLQGASRLEREAIFWHYPHYGNQGGTPGSSVRCGDYKLIEFFEDGRLELYDLIQDPSESFNLAAELPDVAKELHSRLADWREEVSARYPGKR